VKTTPGKRLALCCWQTLSRTLGARQRAHVARRGARDQSRVTIRSRGWPKGTFKGGPENSSRPAPLLCRPQLVLKCPGPAPYEGRPTVSGQAAGGPDYVNRATESSPSTTDGRSPEQAAAKSP
jgi:hypothetical protein